MKNLAIAALLLAGAMALTGCPMAVQTDTAVPTLTIGARYIFHAGGQEETSGTVAALGPGSWVRLESGDWINLDETFHVRIPTKTD